MITERFKAVSAALRARESLVVMYSGGLDSHVLASLAFEALGGNACALTIQSPVIPSRDLADAMAGAAMLGITHRLIQVDELAVDDFAHNDPDRCYRCRKIRNRIVLDWAAAAGFVAVAEGANTSDLADYRPGLRASDEDGIWKPFIEFGLSKDDLREYARLQGMPRWDRPATVCLCSRVPYGSPLTHDALRMIEAAEAVLHGLSLSPCRVRLIGKAAMIEIEEPEALMPLRKKVTAALLDLGFDMVGLDLEGFASGKLNRGLRHGNDGSAAP